MTRALIAGVTGMRANALKMDVIGNNIANVNTVGYKSSKALFSDLLSQTVNGGTAAVSGGTGGMNPIQIGLGVKLASIQANFSQGSLMATGAVNDCAISGNGFFVMNNGENTMYTRDGAFSLDANNNLVNPANGYKVQGWTADANGAINTLETIGDLVIPFGSSTIAAATENVELVGNLNSGGDDGVSSIAASGIMYIDATQTTRASGSTLLTALYDDAGNALDLEAGDTLSFGATKGAGTITTRTYTVTASSSLSDIAQFMEESFGIVTDDNAAATEGVTVSGVDTGQTAGQLVMVGNIGDANAITAITISGSDASGGTALNTTAFQNIFGPDLGNNGFTEVQAADGESSFTQVVVYDSLGQAHTVDYVFARASANTYSFFANSDSNYLAGSRGTSVRLAAGTLEFQTSGAFTQFTGNTIELNLTNGAETPYTITIDATEMTGFGTTTSVNLGNQDGFPPGNLNDYTIGGTGVITGIYSNGLTRNIGQIALASFPNTDGLLAQGDNLYSPGVNAGAVDIGEAIAEGRGAIASGFLENSNVDLGEEFSQMILTQRAYQASARTISTADALLAEAVNLV